MSRKRRSARLHEARMNGDLKPLIGAHEPLDVTTPPDILADPELLAAWRSLQLYWLETVPGYREEIKARVNEVQRRRRWMDTKIQRAARREVDNLGQEIDPCG